MKSLDQKFDQLKKILSSYRSVIVAYSGGVDSAFLAKVAHDVLGEKSLAIIADSVSLPRRELEEALQVGKQFGFPVRIVPTNEMANPSYTTNPTDRCYFCKHELFETLAPIARAEQFDVICSGENTSDAGDVRPGAQAAAEFSVQSPLKKADLTKPEIRELSRALGLPTAEKAQMACLSSRLPYGEEVTPRKLAMIEAAENVLRDAGFYDVRVRHHEFRGRSPQKAASEGNDLEPAASSFPISLARLELGSSEMARLLDNALRARIVGALKEIGYIHVTLDLLGYRCGSMNETLGKP